MNAILYSWAEFQGDVITWVVVTIAMLWMAREVVKSLKKPRVKR